jgi:hypothetical protein
MGACASVQTGLFACLHMGALFKVLLCGISCVQYGCRRRGGQREAHNGAVSSIARWNLWCNCMAMGAHAGTLFSVSSGESLWWCFVQTCPHVHVCSQCDCVMCNSGLERRLLICMISCGSSAFHSCCVCPGSPAWWQLRLQAASNQVNVGHECSI